MIKMDKSPLISVVMPVYNTEKYLPEVIESVLNQSFKDFEFIIVNDCSTDKSLEIIEMYAKKDKRIKILNNEENFGISKTRNNGIEKARGRYIVTQDSDDISVPERFEAQLKYLENHPKVGVVGSHIDIFHDDRKERSVREYPEKDSVLRKIIFFASPIAQPASMIRKKVFEDVGLYDENYPPVEDLDLWFRIGNKYELANVQKILVLYREGSNSATSRKTRLMEKLTLKIRFKNWNNYNYPRDFNAGVYNFLHLFSLYLIPSKVKWWVFKKIRDKKK